MTELRKLIAAANAPLFDEPALAAYLLNHAEDIAALIEAAQKHGVCAERHHDGTHTGCDVDAQLSAALHPFEATP